MKNFNLKRHWNDCFPNALKILVIMKLTIFLFLISAFNLFAKEIYSQNKKLNLHMKDATVQEILSEIESQSDYYFMYSEKIIDVDRKVSMHTEDQSVELLLNKLFQGTNVVYTVKGRLIVLSAPGNTDAPGHSMQPFSVSGKVTDSSGNPLPGVTVVIKGSSKGVITDIAGNYSIVNVPENAILVFSFIGMKSQEIATEGRSRIIVQMEEELVGIEEVVAVGFGVQKKVNLTGSVAVVNSEELASRPVSRVTEALQGLVPGLNVAVTKQGGQLDAARNIDIRGSGTIGTGSKAAPLILIDGMEGDINALNPQDIESISVLKDAAASSIYGSRAPFGVILITTQKGKTGKAVINYNNSFRFDSPIGLPEMADSYSWALYFNDAQPTGSMFSDEKLQQIKDYRDGKSTKYMFPNPQGKWEVWDDLALLPTANTDWLKEHYKHGAFSQEHSISMNEGNEKIQYYASANFLDRNGLLKHADDNLERYSVTGRINARISEQVSFGYSTRFIREDYSAPSYLAASGGLFYHNIARYWPIVPVVDPNGFYTEDSKIYQLKNGGQKKYQKDWLYQQASLVVEPVKGWKIIGELNYRIESNHTHEDYLTTYAYKVDKTPYVTDNWTSSVYEYNYKKNFFNPNIYTEYAKEIGEGHNLKVMAGFQSELMKTRDVGVTGQNLITPGLPVLELTTGTVKINDGGYEEWATVGFFGRVNYDYKGRYLAEINMRYDGTSRFLSDNRWSVFPSFSAGWNIAREKFFEPYADKITTLKIRGSWGELGNQNTENLYPFYQVMELTQNKGNWLLAGKKPNTANMPALVSALLTWEKIRSWNIGLDLGMFSNRLSASLDYFERSTLDMVGPAPELPATLGATVPKVNNADMVSRGFELAFNWKDKIGELNYRAAFLLADDRQKITRYPNDSREIYDKWGNAMWYKGKYIGDIWGYTTIGIAKTKEEMDAHLAKADQSQLGSNWNAGDIMYADSDDDKKISKGLGTVDKPGDLKVIGNDNPRFKFGLNLDAAYKGFDVKLFFQGVAKRDFWASGPMFWGADGGKWQSVGYKEHMDYFRNDPDHPLGLNLDSYYPAPNWDSSKNRKVQTRYLQNAAYLRLKNLQIGYTIPKNITQKFSVSHMRVFASFENLFTITSLSDQFDPETIQGGDWGNGKTYPISKTTSFGVSVTL